MRHQLAFSFVCRPNRHCRGLCPAKAAENRSEFGKIERSPPLSGRPPNGEHVDFRIHLHRRRLDRCSRTGLFRLARSVVAARSSARAVPGCHRGRRGWRAAVDAPPAKSAADRPAHPKALRDNRTARCMARSASADGPAASSHRALRRRRHRRPLARRGEGLVAQGEFGRAGFAAIAE